MVNRHILAVFSEKKLYIDKKQIYTSYLLKKAYLCKSVNIWVNKLTMYEKKLELSSLRRSRERDDVADVLHTSDEEDKTLKTEPETSVGA